MTITAGIELAYLPSRRVASVRVARANDSFSDFVTVHQRSLVGFATLVCGSREEAEDVVQEVLARAYLKWERIGAPEMDTVAYLNRMIVNQHNSLWRRAFRRRELSTAEPPEQAIHPDDPDDAMWARVMALPPRQRQVVALRFYLDMSVADAAQTLGCSEGTIKSQTHHALATLRGAVLRERQSE